MVAALSGLSSLLGSASSLLGIKKVNSSATSPAPSAAASGPNLTTDTQSISTMGQLLGKLQQLQKKDPQKLRVVLGQIADKLDSAAQQSSASDGASLTQLANTFRKAALTGDLSPLQTLDPTSSSRGAGLNAYMRNQPGIQGSNGLTALMAGPQTSLGKTMQQVLTDANNQVDQALKGA